MSEHIYEDSDMEHERYHVIPFGWMREEIVRCRECVYRRRSWNGHEPNFIDDWFCSYTGGHEVKPDGFCAWGERRQP